MPKCGAMRMQVGLWALHNDAIDESSIFKEQQVGRPVMGSDGMEGDGFGRSRRQLGYE